MTSDLLSTVSAKRDLLLMTLMSLLFAKKLGLEKIQNY